jgi:hypothetical protein
MPFATNDPLLRRRTRDNFESMSAKELIEEFNALPPDERARVTKYVVEHDDSWIPDEFKEAMKDAEAGRFVDMETALRETPPPHLR